MNCISASQKPIETYVPWYINHSWMDDHPLWENGKSPMLSNVPWHISNSFRSESSFGTRSVSTPFCRCRVHENLRRSESNRKPKVMSLLEKHRKAWSTAHHSKILQIGMAATCICMIKDDQCQDKAHSAMHASTKLLSHSDDAHCWRYCATAFGQGRKDLSIDQRSGAFKMLQMGKISGTNCAIVGPNFGST